MADSRKRKNSKNVSQKLHLYVDDDDNPISAPRKDGEVVSVRFGDPALIPCRPAHPGYQGCGKNFDLLTFSKILSFLLNVLNDWLIY
jgi:hypothetical protein